MKACFLGAVSAGPSSIMVGRIVENLEEEKCSHCLKPFQSGERFAVLKIVNEKDIAVHLQCACIWREKMGSDRAQLAGVRAPG